MTAPDPGTHPPDRHPPGTHHFGFKLSDRNPQPLEPVLAYAVRHRLPVEVGLYRDDPATHALFRRYLSGAALPVNAHTHHERCHAGNLQHSLPLLEAHIRSARSLGSTYSVLHPSLLPLPRQACRRPALLELLLDNLERAEAVCTRLEYRLFLENIFHSSDFYRELFAGIRARGLTRLHFCFDLGHAQVWSGNTLDDWLNLLEELAAAGFALHCHLHANRGLTDEHLSLPQIRALGAGEAAADFAAPGYPETYWLLERRFPAAVKVFEVAADQAIANLEAVLAAAPA
jgi:hypothetical protein